MKFTLWMVAATCGTLLAGCAHVQVDPIEVKPIYITMDVNIRIDRQLDNFFAFEDQVHPASATQPSTRPSTPTTQVSI